MRILVLHTQVPFVRGGAEVLVNGLVLALRKRGHEADVVSLPLRWNPPEHLLESAIAWRMLDLTEVAGDPVDLVICTKFPTWAVRHPNKVLWLIHQHRQAYDLYGSAYSEFGADWNNQELRAAVFDIDRTGIGECRRRYAISRNVSARLREHLGIEATPLYPPVEDRDLWPEAYDPFVLSVARLDPMKRVDALIDAWPLVDDSLTLNVVSDGPLRSELERRVAQLGIEKRVEFLGRVDDARLDALFRTCRAVYYAPFDEDYGYTAVEALSAAKPVITSPDSGGVLEFIRHGETGEVSSLDPACLAEAVNTYVSTEAALRQGERGRLETSGITWDGVVAALTGSTP